MKWKIMLTIVAAILAGCSPIASPLLEVSVDGTSQYWSGQGFEAELTVKNTGNCDVDATILTTFSLKNGAAYTAENEVSLSMDNKTSVSAEWVTDFDSSSMEIDSVSADYRVDDYSDAQRP